MNGVEANVKEDVNKIKMFWIKYKLIGGFHDENGSINVCEVIYMIGLSCRVVF